MYENSIACLCKYFSSMIRIDFTEIIKCFEEKLLPPYISVIPNL